MEELRTLLATITPGTRVRSTGHDANEHSGLATVERVTDKEIRFRLDRAVSSQGRSFRTSRLGLDTLTDYEVDGRTLKIYNPRHAYTGGRALTRTIEFLETEQSWD